MFSASAAGAAGSSGADSTLFAGRTHGGAGAAHTADSAVAANSALAAGTTVTGVQEIPKPIATTPAGSAVSARTAPAAGSAGALVAVHS